jgi:hypothetical protein
MTSHEQRSGEQGNTEVHVCTAFCAAVPVPAMSSPAGSIGEWRPAHMQEAVKQNHIEESQNGVLMREASATRSPLSNARKSRAALRGASG